MRAVNTGTSTINPISSNPSSHFSTAAQARPSESSAVPLQWLPILLASSVDPQWLPPSPLPPPACDVDVDANACSCPASMVSVTKAPAAKRLPAQCCSISAGAGADPAECPNVDACCKAGPPNPTLASPKQTIHRALASGPMWDAVGTSWRLVRRVAAGDTWHPSADHLAGTDVYGVMPSGIPQTADATFSISFSGESFTHFLFATGDEQVWLYCTKEAVLPGPYSNNQRPILKSSDSLTPYSARWYNRNGVNEDPWISVTDHHGSAIPGGKLVYGADSFGGDHATTILPHHNGANVWIY